MDRRRREGDPCDAGRGVGRELRARMRAARLAAVLATAVSLGSCYSSHRRGPGEWTELDGAVGSADAAEDTWILHCGVASVASVADVEGFFVAWARAICDGERLCAQGPTWTADECQRGWASELLSLVGHTGAAARSADAGRLSIDCESALHCLARTRVTCSYEAIPLWDYPRLDCAAALRRPESEPLGMCASDYDCADREYCRSAGDALGSDGGVGYCAESYPCRRFDPPTGVACRTDDECRGGVCAEGSCRRNDGHRHEARFGQPCGTWVQSGPDTAERIDCADGHFCHVPDGSSGGSGTCIELPGAGEPVLTSAGWDRCARGFYPSYWLGGPLVCEEWDFVGPGEPCPVRPQGCGFRDDFCDESRGVCTTALPGGRDAPCDSYHSCALGLACPLGSPGAPRFCADLLGLGAVCSRNADCISGPCGPFGCCGPS